MFYNPNIMSVNRIQRQSNPSPLTANTNQADDASPCPLGLLSRGLLFQNCSWCSNMGDHGHPSRHTHSGCPWRESTANTLKPVKAGETSSTHLHDEHDWLPLEFCQDPVGQLHPADPSVPSCSADAATGSLWWPATPENIGLGNLLFSNQYQHISC